jgi:hypothetical protein
MSSVYALKPRVEALFGLLAPKVGNPPGPAAGQGEQQWPQRDKLGG